MKWLLKKKRNASLFCVMNWNLFFIPFCATEACDGPLVTSLLPPSFRSSSQLSSSHGPVFAKVNRREGQEIFEHTALTCPKFRVTLKAFIFLKLTTQKSFHPIFTKNSNFPREPDSCFGDHLPFYFSYLKYTFYTVIYFLNTTVNQFKLRMILFFLLEFSILTIRMKLQRGFLFRIFIVFIKFCSVQSTTLLHVYSTDLKERNMATLCLSKGKCRTFQKRFNGDRFPEDAGIALDACWQLRSMARPMQCQVSLCISAGHGVQKRKERLQLDSQFERYVCDEVRQQYRQEWIHTL